MKKPFFRTLLYVINFLGISAQAAVTPSLPSDPGDAGSSLTPAPSQPLPLPATLDASASDQGKEIILACSQSDNWTGCSVAMGVRG